MKHGFIKIASAVPEVTVAAPLENARRICELIDKAYAGGAALVTFPELSVSAYTCGDLFLTAPLVKNSESAILSIAEHTAGKKILVFVGAPIIHGGKLYNCAIAISNGAIIGVIPKSNIPNYGEFYELRAFNPAPECNSEVTLGGRSVPFGVNMLFECCEMPLLKVACEICEDLFTAKSPAIQHAAAGANVIVNLSASSETIGKEEYRRLLVKSASANLLSAYVYSGAGMGESTTDLVFAGHSMIAENGRIIAENKPFGKKDLIFGIVDLEHLMYDRMRTNTFKSGTEKSYLTVRLSLDLTEVDISGAVAKSPFIPQNESERHTTYTRILDIQAHGLAKRITASRASGCVVALSGGLDSTLALLVTVRALDILGRPHTDVLTVTMPCFGTTARTRSNAESLAEQLGVNFRCIDIKEAVDIHFRDIGHDPGELSVVYENAQARERTQIIMDIANSDGSLVVGTGDLSELALGWATYNGDHMSNYGVNGGVPKTLVRHIVSYCADCYAECGCDALAGVLRDILATPVSPELLPARNGEIAQKTEDIVGPYDLHDFFLYHFVRYGETPEKIYREAKSAFAGEFEDDVILKWLNTFMRRFFSQQFKRSALPDGPKVGSVALSPRGDWRMPSDASGAEMQIQCLGG